MGNKKQESLTILLVEDNFPLAKSTAKLIERLSGHQVQFTDKPETVFELCRSGTIDLVLMDINLSGALWAGEEVSGADISRLLKTESETSHLPIILLSAYAMPNERDSFLADSQADDFFSKPINDYASLIKAIEKLAQKV